MSLADKKVLFVTSPSPCSQSFGSQLRVKTTLDSLQKCSRASLVLASVKDYEPSVLQETARHYDLKAVFRLQPSRARGLDRLKAELSDGHLNTHGFAASPQDREAFRRLAANYDLVWFHTIRLPNAFRVERLPVPTVLDADDLLSRLHESAVGQTSALQRLMARKSAWLWRRREARFLERFDALTVCSEGDKAYLGGSERIHVIPNGFTRSASPVQRARRDPPTIGFVGLLTYEPNRQGLEWFLREVFPLIRRHIPDVTLRVVGKGSESYRGEGVEPAGWIENLDQEFSRWWLTVVPVHIGGGTRVKIATAFSHALPVVSTTLGAYGYEATHGRELMLADTPPAFADACIQVIRDPALAESLARHAVEQFNRHWSPEAIAPKVARVAELATERRQPS